MLSVVFQFSLTFAATGAFPELSVIGHSHRVRSACAYARTHAHKCAVRAIRTTHVGESARKLDATRSDRRPACHSLLANHPKRFGRLCSCVSECLRASVLVCVTSVWFKGPCVCKCGLSSVVLGEQSEHLIAPDLGSTHLANRAEPNMFGSVMDGFRSLTDTVLGATFGGSVDSGEFTRRSPQRVEECVKNGVQRDALTDSYYEYELSDKRNTHCARFVTN